MRNRNPENIEQFEVLKAGKSKYIKYKYVSENANTTTYYFKQARHCRCNDTQQCYRCSLRERPILRKLKKKDDDYKFEEQLKTVTKQKWNRKLKQISDYKDYKSVNN